MSEVLNFNPYARFLALPEHLVEPNHYELLGIEVFTEDRKAILDSAAAQNAKLMRLQNVDAHYATVKRLQAEVATAMSVLAAPERKADYDAELRREIALDAEPALQAGTRPKNRRVSDRETAEVVDYEALDNVPALPNRVPRRKKRKRRKERPSKKRRPGPSFWRRLLYDSSFFGFSIFQILLWGGGSLMLGIFCYSSVPGFGGRAYFKAIPFDDNAPGDTDALIGIWEEGFDVRVQLPDGPSFSRRIVTRRITGHGKYTQRKLLDSDSSEGTIEFNGKEHEYAIRFKRGAGITVTFDGHTIPRSWIP